MKLLVLNKQNPGESKYRNPKNIGAWLFGRRLDNYPMFACHDNGDIERIILQSADCHAIQQTVDTIFKSNNQDKTLPKGSRS